jgi:EAL domain-containing protein (putative c-di-GMP-specific phosphodiesterase class I)
VAVGLVHGGWAAVLDRPLVAQELTASVGLVGLLVLLAPSSKFWLRYTARRQHPEAEDLDSQALADRRRRVQAVLNQGLTMRLVFQPIIDLRSGRCVGHEALARFDEAGPEMWFTEAHELGIGIELEVAAVERALRSEPDLDGYLSLNLSPAALTSPAFHRLIVECGCADGLVLELTEHAIVDDYDEVCAVVAELRQLGARIAVDDAGSGFASMRHILAIAPEIIKLDRSLISAIDTDPARRGLARSLAQFAEEMGADLIAEGVERGEELTVCREVGIRFAQGYLLGRPAPPASRATIVEGEADATLTR